MFQHFFSERGQRNGGKAPEAMCTNTTTYKKALHIVHTNAFFNLKKKRDKEKKKISSICKQFRLNLFLFCE